MRLGKVKWFHPSKGYGYIQPDDGSDDVFVFSPELCVDGQQLAAGQVVHFEADYQHPLGPRSTQIAPIEQ